MLLNGDVMCVRVRACPSVCALHHGGSWSVCMMCVCVAVQFRLECVFVTLMANESVFLFVCTLCCRTVGLECGECDVPSQAFLEWVCVKMVGGACLFTRLLDCCSRTFVYPLHTQTTA